MKRAVQTGAEAIRQAYLDAVSFAFRQLIEGKHLYQSVRVNVDELNSVVGQTIVKAGPVLAASTRSNINKQIAYWNSNPWDLAPEASTVPPLSSRQSSALDPIPLPSARLSCASCAGVAWPHNPGYRNGQPIYSGETFLNSSEIVQVFCLPYQCQNCKGEPVCLLVRRDGLKLSLVGRSHFQEVLVPNFFPDKQRKFYSNAAIADQTGFTLAAALYLRALIEQYFYQTIPEADVKAINGNPTGDELAELYAKTLPKSFPANFPSLKKAYNDLSIIIHSGKEDDDVKKSFQTIRSAVESHFEAVQLFKKMPAQ